MMPTLLVYFVLTAGHTWEFLAIEHVTTRAYCEMLQDDLSKVYKAEPGNMRILCADDEGSEA